MSINSAMYTAVTGLSALGSGMQTISNNIANVSTVGFKAMRTNYEDLISQNYYSGGKANQRGCGVKVSTIQSMFTQGAFMSSAQDTDMAIAGDGFFQVRSPIDDGTYYTRAGVFTLTKDGQMEDPSGNILQGWQMSIPKPGKESTKIGALTDVKITVMNAPPVATSTIKAVNNLDARDKPAYLYRENEMTHEYADAQAVAAAEIDRDIAINATYTSADGVATMNSALLAATSAALGAAIAPGGLVDPANAINWPGGGAITDPYGSAFLAEFNSMFTSGLTAATSLQVVADGTPLGDAEREAGYMTASEFALINQTVQHSTANSVPLIPTLKSAYNDSFLDEYNKRFNSPAPPAVPATLGNLKVVLDGTALTPADRANGFMTEGEFESIKLVALAAAKAKAEEAGRAAYDGTYRTVYENTRDVIEASLTDWQLEGNGFAGAWNAQEEPYIDQESYTHVEPMEIYDSLGNKHKLMVYYQKNPHMENVWDYIITADPLEDARKDSNNKLLLEDTASFSGLIQKGKITFTADGDDRHGGLIKDIEAQNIDLSKSKMATMGEAQYSAATSVTMKNATVGGYFKGSPDIDPFTGEYKSSSRTYTVLWGAYNPALDPNAGTPLASATNTAYWTGNVQFDPPTSGFTWYDDAGNTGFIPVFDKNTAGPYEFGSGMTVTFDQLDTIGGLSFGVPGQDQLTITAQSEQMAWTNLQPNKEGYFDFDVAFVQSASMALHPPYPAGMPTVIQNIAMDMGARNPNGLSTEWILDEDSTTQYADESATFFNGQDGYPAGSLQRVSIGEDGVVTGIYSNGRHQPLYQIGLVRFMNPWGLSKEGDNLFTETRYSGAGAINQPGYGGTGTILANYLEQSNVDIAEEIVNMIVTQRGFQSNSKTVTTTDTMLAEVIEMKR